MATITKLTTEQEQKLKLAVYAAVADQVQKEYFNQIDEFNAGGHERHKAAMAKVLEQMRTAVATEEERQIARRTGKFNYIGSWPEETYNLLMTQDPDGIVFDKNYDYLKFLSKREEFSPLKKMPLLTRDPKTL